MTRCAPAAGEVRLFWIRPQSDAPWLEHRLLDASERRALDGTRSPRVLALRASARVLLRLALSRCAEVAPADWRFRVAPRGRPSIDQPRSRRGLSFGLAHTEGLVVCAISATGDVGVDVEPEDRPVRAVALARRFFSAAEAAVVDGLPSPARERRLLATWIRSEAAVKAAGLGIAEGLSRWVADPSAFGPLGLQVLRLPPGHRVAVALRGEDAARLRVAPGGALDAAAGLDP